MENSAKALRVDIESAKATLGSALFTELKNKAVKRHLGDELHDQFSITLADMKSGYSV